MATPSWFHHGAVVVVLWTNAPVVLSAPIRAAPVRSLPRAVPPLRSAPRTLFLGVAKRRGDGDDDPPASVQAGFRVWRPIPSKRVSEGGPSLRAAFAFSVLVLLIPANVPSRPGEFHPEPLTDPDMNLSIHPARAIHRRLPPSVEIGGLLRSPVGPSLQRGWPPPFAPWALPHFS